MAKIGDLQLDLKTNVAHFEADLKRAANAVDKMAKQWESMNSKIQAGVAVVAGSAMFTKMISEAAEAEKIMAKVDQVIRSTGGAAGVTSKQVQELANRISQLTGVDDDAIAEAEGLLLTFTKIGKEVFPQATEAVVNLSVAMKQDLKSSAIQVGKALNDPIQGINALKRVGVSFTASQVELVKHLEKTGQHLKAQQVILKELETEFGGAGAAARDSLGGALDALKTNTDNLLQSLGASGGGGLRFAIEGVNIAILELMDNLPAIANVFQTAIEVTGEYGRAVYDTLKPVLNFIMNFWDAATKVAANGVSVLQQHVENIGRLMQGKGMLPLAQAYGVDDYLDAFKQDRLGELEKGFTDFGKKVTDTIDAMGQRAKKWKGSGAGIVGEAMGLTKEQLKEQKRDLDQAIKDIDEAMAALRQEREKDYDAIKKKAEEWAKQEQQLMVEKREAYLKDKEALESILKSKDQQAKLLAAELSGNRELVAQMQAQSEVAKLTHLSVEKRAEAERQITEHILAQEKARDESKIQKMLEGFAKEEKYLEMALAGREKEAEILKEVEAALDSVNLSKEEEAEIGEKLKGEIATRNALKEAVDRQKKALKDLEEAQKKAYEEVKKWTDKIVNGFADSITSGKKLKDVFKDLGKELAALAAKKLLLEPLSNAISNNVYRWLYGGAPPGQGGGAQSMGGLAAAGGGGLLGKLGGLFGFGGGKGAAPALAGAGQGNAFNSPFLMPFLGGSGRPGTSSAGGDGWMQSLIQNTAKGPAWRAYVVNCPCSPSELANAGAPPAGTPGTPSLPDGGPVRLTGPVTSYGPVTNAGSGSSTSKSTSSSSSSMDSGLMPMLMGGLLMGGLAGMLGGGGQAQPQRAPRLQTTQRTGGLILNQQEAVMTMTSQRDQALREFDNTYSGPGVSVDPRLVSNWRTGLESGWNQQIDTTNKTQWFTGYNPAYGRGASYSSGWGSLGNANALSGMVQSGAFNVPYWADTSQGRHTPGVSGAGGNYGGIGYSLPGLLGQQGAPGRYADTRGMEALINGLRRAPISTSGQLPGIVQDRDGLRPFDFSHIPTNMGGWGPVSGNPMSLFGRAAGGPVNGGQPYLVGEKGPEVFWPSSAGKIAPNKGGEGAFGQPKISIVNNGAPIVVEKQTVDANGNTQLHVANAVAAAQSSPQVQSAQRRQTGVRAQPVRRG